MLVSLDAQQVPGRGATGLHGKNACGPGTPCTECFCRAMPNRFRDRSDRPTWQECLWSGHSVPGMLLSLDAQQVPGRGATGLHGKNACGPGTPCPECFCRSMPSKFPVAERPDYMDFRG